MKKLGHDVLHDERQETADEKPTSGTRSPESTMRMHAGTTGANTQTCLAGAAELGVS